MPQQALIYLILLQDFSLQWKPVGNLSDMLKMWVSPPWNLSLLLPYTAPKLPGLVLAQIYTLKCASCLNSGSVDPFIMHFKPGAICASFHWNGCVLHPENDSSLCSASTRFQTTVSLAKISSSSYTQFWKCYMSFADKIKFSSILRRNQIIHTAHWCFMFLSFKAFGSWTHRCEFNHFSTVDEFCRPSYAPSSPSYWCGLGLGNIFTQKCETINLSIFIFALL